MQKLNGAAASDSPEDDNELLLENTIRRNFDNLNVIGDGTYGVVYKAREKATGKYVALKRIRISFTENGVPLSAMREITTLKHLHYHNHPNVVRLLDICQGNNRGNSLMLFLIFEHLDQNLYEYVQKHNSIDSRRIKDFTRQLLNGLDFLHSHRVVHRDLKPQNILISENNELKIADFGLAKIYDNEMRLTSLVQTLWYRAPEVILGLQYATGIDVWATGCIMVEMFLKRPLFIGTSEVDQLNKIFRVIGTPSEAEWPSSISLPRTTFYNWKPVQINSFIPELSLEGIDLLMKMLRFNPKDRISAQTALFHSYFNDTDQ